MNLAFISPLKHVGLSLAIGLGACLNAGLLFFLLRKHGIYRPGKGWAAFLVKMAISLAAVCGWHNLICRLNGCTSAALKKQDNSAS